GATAVAVPGEIAGYSELHTKLGGKLKWKDLFEPAIGLARKGFKVGDYLDRALQKAAATIKNNPSMKEIFWNKKDDRVFQKGDTLVQGGLAQILTDLADKGKDHFYKGALAQSIVAQLGSGGPTAQDLEQYVATWKPALKASLGDDWSLHTTPPPGSGAIFSLALQIMMVYGVRDNKDLAFHRMVEAVKYALAKRPELGDTQDAEKVYIIIVQEMTNMKFVNEIKAKISDKGPLKDISEYGLKHSFRQDGDAVTLSLYSAEGDALVISSTINKQ
ncbi:unnamed protein product, partial [Ixodes hexagonus]